MENDVKKPVVDFQKTAINEGGQQFIRIREQKFNEKFGFAESSRTAFLEVKPEKADITLEALQSGELGYQIGALNRQTRLWEVKVYVAAEMAATPETVAEGEAIQH